MPGTPQLFSPSELLADDEELEAEFAPSPPAQPTEPEPTPEQQAEIDRLERQLAELQQRDEATRRELAAREEQFWRLDEREKQIAEARQAADQAVKQYEQQQADARPEDWDPVGQRLWDQNKQLEQLGARIQQHEQVRAQAEFNQWVNSQGQAFAQQNPDYQQAVEFLAADRVKFWQNAGYPQQQAIHIVASEASALANSARKTGKNFAAILYNEARARGYRPGVISM